MAAFIPLRISALVALAFAALAFAAGSASAQPTEACQDTPGGRICRVTQPIVQGTLVPQNLQKQLGLVTVNGGCSGTLLTRFWVLTARHCVTAPALPPGCANAICGLLLPPAMVTITADWAPGRTATATRIREFAVNTAPGILPDRDIVLIYFGSNDLGEVNLQTPYIEQETPTQVERWTAARLTAADTVNQYGQGFSTLATGTFGTPTATPAAGLGNYRTAVFTPSNVSATEYTLAMNASNQVGHGGDSGGPTYVQRSNGTVQIAGVQSTCFGTLIPGVPAGPWNWAWAASVTECYYVSVEPLVQEIGQAIKESPVCSSDAICALPALLNQILD